MPNPSKAKKDLDLENIEKAWDQYAKAQGFATEHTEGRQPDDADVLSFINNYLTKEYKYTLSNDNKGLEAFRRIADEQPEAMNQEQVGFLKEIRQLIRHRLSTKQIKQLQWELENG